MKADCPVCKGTIDALTLAEIVKHVKHCGRPGKKPRAAKAVTPPMATFWELPLSLSGDRKTPSQNLYKATMHWRYVTEAKAWKTHMFAPLFNAKLIGANLSWSRWQLTRLYSGREKAYDYGNLVGGAKPVPDALKHHGVIVDVDPDHFKMDYSQMEVPTGSGWQLALLEYRP